MKVTCQTCGAKYTVSDEKVQGKTVKIRCKKCGTSIVVGEEAGPQAGSDLASTSPGGWSVMVGEGDQRSLTEAQIRELFRNGTIDDGTYVWRDGMPDWVPMSEVPELAEALRAIDEDQPTRMGTVPAEIMAMGRRRQSDAPPPAGSGRPDLFGGGGAPKAIEEDQATTMFNSGAAAAAAFGSPSPAPAARRPAAGAPAPRSPFAAPAPAPAPAVAAAPPPRPTPAFDDAPRAIADGDASGMIDIRMLQASRQPPPKPAAREKVDDLFGASAAPSLFDAPAAAPPMLSLDLNAPSPPEPPPPPPPVSHPAHAMPMAAPMPAPQPKKGGAGLVIGLVLGAVILVGGGATAAAVLLKKDAKPEEKTAAAATGDTAKSPETGKAPDAAPDAPKASADAAPSGAAPPPSPDTTAAPADPKKPKTAAELKKEAEEKKKKEKEEESKKKEEEAKKKAEEEKKKQPEETAPPASGDGPPFDRAAALSVLSGAAGAAQSCKTPDGPTGNGRASVTFAPSGKVTQAVIEGAFAGTSVGSCIAAKFRGAKVPSFGGSPVTVKKSFSVN